MSAGSTRNEFFFTSRETEGKVIPIRPDEKALDLQFQSDLEPDHADRGGVQGGKRVFNILVLNDGDNELVDFKLQMSESEDGPWVDFAGDGTWPAAITVAPKAEIPYRCWVEGKYRYFRFVATGDTNGLATFHENTPVAGNVGLG